MEREPNRCRGPGDYSLKYDHYRLRTAVASESDYYDCPWGWPSRGGADYPPSWEKIPPAEDPGLCDPLGEPGWLSW